MSSDRHLAVGLLFLLVIIVLGGYTLFLTDFSLGGKSTLTVYFSDTNGLRTGDAAQVAGMRWGKVDVLTFDPTADQERRITAEIALNEPIDLHEDFEITIEDATLLGGKVLAIEPGTATLPVVPPDQPLYGRVAPNVMEALGEVVDENREPLSNAIAGLSGLVEDVRSGPGVLNRLVYDGQLADDVEAAVGSISTTFENTSTLTQKLVDGEGTLGKLFAEDSVYFQLESIASGLAEVIELARTGPGILSRVLNDQALADDAAAAVAEIRSIAESINQGEGTIGMLVNDHTIAENVQTLTQRLVDGEGTLGKLFTEDEIYENVRVISEDLKVTAAALREGDGTIGRLIQDDELYVELRRALAMLTGSLEEAREAAPITTLVNALFLGF